MREKPQPCKNAETPHRNRGLIESPHTNRRPQIGTSELLPACRQVPRLAREEGEKRWIVGHIHARRVDGQGVVLDVDVNGDRIA